VWSVKCGVWSCADARFHVPPTVKIFQSVVLRASVNFTLHTPHFTLHTPHSTLHTPHSKMLRWPRFKNLISNSRKLLISAHRDPDGDALGSELALCTALESLGYDVTIMNSDLPADQFRFLGRDFERFHQFSEAGPGFFDSFDAWIVVDTSSLSQLGKMAAVVEKGLKTLVIDHHAVADQITKYNFSDPKEPAAGCLVMELIQKLGVSLDFKSPDSDFSIADFLYFAIATDTGWFRFPSTLPKTLRQAAELIETGASNADLYRWAYENYAPARLKLLGVVAQTATFIKDGKIAYAWIKKSDFRKFGGTKADTKDLVNTLLTTAGIQAVVLFVETSEGIRLNLRSRGDFNVAEIARQFGGGGHKNAAGATILKPLKEAIEETVKSIMNQELGFLRD